VEFGLQLRFVPANAKRCREGTRSAQGTRAAAPEVRQRLLAAIYAGQPFRQVLGDLGLTSNQVWGLTKTDKEWLAALDAALAATRRDDLRHGTNAAYVAGCVCKECREHQRIRMARNREYQMSLYRTTASS
jgi:hypothetical protein